MNATASGLPELTALVSRRVQKATVDAAGRIVLELFGGADKEKAWLVVDRGGVAVIATRPAGTGEAPPAVQGLVRKELVPAALAAVTMLSAGALALRFERPEGAPRTLVIEADADDARAVVCADTDEGLRVLATIGGAPRPRDGRDLRRGRRYLPPSAAPRRAATAPRVDGAAHDQLASLRAQLKAEHKRLARLVAALERDLARHGDGARLEADGELLKTALAKAPRGTAALDVVDFEGSPRTLTLDPAHDAAHNLARLFARARRARQARAKVTPRLQAARLRQDEVAAARALLEGAPTPAQVEGATRALTDTERTIARSARRSAARAGKRQPWRSFTATGSVVVRVGRGAKDNDALVKDARGNDLWLHARAVHGAHVVVPSRGDDVDAELLLDAAHLAAHFSAARGEPRVDVQHTRVKHVKKPGPGAAAGLVHVTQESVLHLRVDAERLRRLLAAEVPS